MTCSGLQSKGMNRSFILSFLILHYRFSMVIRVYCQSFFFPLPLLSFFPWTVLHHACSPQVLVSPALSFSPHSSAPPPCLSLPKANSHLPGVSVHVPQQEPSRSTGWAQEEAPCLCAQRTSYVSQGESSRSKAPWLFEDREYG